jgi:hypothetical protein
MTDNKPSFFNSMMSGINGYAKGFFAGGAVGALSGLVVGAVIAIFAGPAAILGGIAYGAAFFAGIGALSGTVTEVVRSRETQQVSGQDAATTANVAFAQGVTVGRNLEVADTQRKFQEAEAKRRAEAELAAQQGRQK